MKKTEQTSYIFIPDPEEQRLIARLIVGDMSGYETLFNKYYPSCHAFIRSMTKDAAVAEDIAQNVFMKVWINREKLDENKSMRNYLFVLARNEIYNYFRTKTRTFTSLQDAILYPDAKGGGGSAMPRNEIEEQLDLDQTTERLEAIIGGMPPQRQRIFRLSRFEHLSSRDIAEQLGLSVRTVEKHLELAIKELRKYLAVIPAIILLLDILP